MYKAQHGDGPPKMPSAKHNMAITAVNSHCLCILGQRSSLPNIQLWEEKRFLGLRPSADLFGK